MTTPAQPADLITWLRAQLDEDARLIDEYDTFQRGLPVAAIVVPPGWLLGEPFDIGRQRAEVDAKRRVIEWCIAAQDRMSAPAPLVGMNVLAALALPYAPRPGYRPEWKP